MKNINKVLDILEETYPDAKCELDYNYTIWTISSNYIIGSMYRCKGKQSYRGDV